MLGSYKFPPLTFICAPCHLLRQNLWLTSGEHVSVLATCMSLVDLCLPHDLLIILILQGIILGCVIQQLVGCVATYSLHVILV